MTRCLPLLVVAMLVIAACGSAQPSSAKPAEVCAPPAEPGPADEPNRDGEEDIHLSDFGAGRWRLCLTEPGVAAAEGTVWCVWTEDRSTVLELNGHRIKVDALNFETYLSFTFNRFELRAIDLGGTPVANYQPGSTLPSGTTPDAGRSGTLAFQVVLRIDPETGAPVGVAPGYSGAMTWKCGDPPPPG